jgi:hypothetical protein
MTRHRHAQTGLVTPQLPQLLLTVVLRVFAMLVSSVASTLRMRLRRPAVNATRQMPQSLPRMKIDKFKEQHAAQHRSSLNSAHGEQRSSAARPSNHERVLAAPSPSVSLAPQAIHLPLLRMGRQTLLRGIASTAFGGGGGSPRLRGETEGASQRRHSLRVRRKPAPRASRAICVQTGLRQQPWIPACAGTSGDSVTSSNKNAAA